MELTDKYLTHSLNNSISKASYSFSKQKRNERIQKNLHRFYNLPSLKSNRSASIGFGCKVSLAHRSIAPSPNRYNIKSQFQNSSISAGIAFGKSRDQIKFGNFLQIVRKSKELPAPNKYNTSFCFPTKRLGITIGQRLKTDMDYLMERKTPGPGSYTPKNMNLSNSGLFFVSTMKNQGITKYHNPENQLASKKNTKINFIGPASYNLYTRQFGKSVLSQFRNATKGSFSKSLRYGLADKQKGKIPGPKYQVFSEFGTKKM